MPEQDIFLDKALIILFLLEIIAGVILNHSILKGDRKVAVFQSVQEYLRHM